MKKKISGENVKQKKEIRIRVEENQLGIIKSQAKLHKTSLNGYVNFILNSFTEKEEILWDEKIGIYEKKEIESRVFFTKSEIGVLKRYAELSGDWSVSQQIRHMIVSRLSKKPKLNGEELKAIYSVRSSINVLGANINRLVRDSEILRDENIEICKDLLKLIKELKDKISYLEKCNHSSFKLREAGGKNGNQG